jgi:hypothetical protein
MTDYETLIYKLGSLHSTLRELAEYAQYQGEHTIAYSSGGIQRTLHIYIDGTDLQMSESPIISGFSFSTHTSSGD